MIKKVLGGILVLGLIVAVTVGIWMVTGSNHFVIEREASINVPRELIYMVLTEPKYRTRFGNGLQRFRRKEGEAFAPGTQNTFELVEGETTHRFRETVLEASFPEFFAVTLATEWVEMNQRYEFTTTDSGTQVKLKVEGDFRGKARWGGNYGRSMMTEKVEADLESLKLALERNPGLPVLIEEAREFAEAR